MTDSWGFGVKEVQEQDIPELYLLAQRLGAGWWRLGAAGLLPWTLFPRALAFRAQGSWVIRATTGPGLGYVAIYDLDPRAGLAWLDLAADDAVLPECAIVAAWAINRVVAVGDARAVYIAYPEFCPPPAGLVVTPQGGIEDFVEHQGSPWTLRYAAIRGADHDAGS